VLHLRTIRVEQWSPEALTSAGRKGLPGDAEPVGAVEVRGIRTWKSSAGSRCRPAHGQGMATKLDGKLIDET